MDTEQKNKGFLQEKGTDYPSEPVQSDLPPDSQGSPPSSKPRFPWKSVVWFSVGAVVILGGGIYGAGLP